MSSEEANKSHADAAANAPKVNSDLHHVVQLATRIYNRFNGNGHGAEAPDERFVSTKSLMTECRRAVVKDLPAMTAWLLSNPLNDAYPVASGLLEAGAFNEAHRDRDHSGEFIRACATVISQSSGVPTPEVAAPAPAVEL